MNMRNLVPWVCVVALVCVAGFLLSTTRRQAVELVDLRASVGEVDGLRQELEEATERHTQLERDLQRLRKNTEDLARLRNEVSQLRQEKQQLATQAQTAQQKAQTAQQSVSATTQQQAEQARQLQQLLAENQQLRSQQTESETLQTNLRNICINHLRQMDGVKASWALENQKTTADTPVADELKVYLRGNQMPVCPAGGTYTINPVAVPPVCSVPGHALPQ